jgi:G3E family GTPase
VKDVYRAAAPDYLFVEPASQVLTHELRAVAAMARRDIAYDVGVFVTLVDGPLFDDWWEERRDLLLGQISGADLVAVSQADALDRGALARVHETLAPHAKGVLTLSTRRGWGVETVLASIT